MANAQSGTILRAPSPSSLEYPPSTSPSPLAAAPTPNARLDVNGALALGRTTPT